MAIIRFDNVTFRQNGKPIIEDFSFTFPEGELTLLLGPAGSGKGLILKMIAGIVEPDDGQVLCDGADVFSGSDDEIKRIRAKISYLFRSGGLISNLTIKENLLLPLDFHFPEILKQEKRQMIDNYLNEFGILSSKEKRPADVSRSICKQVGLIRSLIIQSKIMLFDEPFYDCDIRGKLLIQHQIERNKKNKITQIILTQSTENLIEFADWIMIFENGKVQEMNRRDEILNSDNSITKFYL
ncbi:ABC transporter-related protein [Chloroherpeton thalassium ATCC 35110]|uniref:ABC transporter-related protein n=1 Tax=Chloroherpeton thalassium (strain ATCC 35110 / GB-78) TaxID=517418 RepID=B3QVW8_CHLT3|nr:ATP-binding cassette domain-containing protein [Chloroherpeton thalassium]ACF14622.1 ABC transporter-related protein [Chloroherpeton thalassium ATCC 35110]